MNLSKCVSITYLFLFSGGVESVDRIKIDNATFYSMKPFEYIFFSSPDRKERPDSGPASSPVALLFGRS